MKNGMNARFKRRPHTVGQLQQRLRLSLKDAYCRLFNVCQPLCICLFQGKDRKNALLQISLFI
ncbi:hypothetical protein SAMN05421823_101461 [Catalinimonas alkaloidigena]|uniref:Uncharacterized protein n=1 Tax=Catalinimonas alkaloidigena TaxID=1075417 RepID=A0A1G8XSH2_9BACT|nr:hypothetical protein SAMN05421823_101461 [Catalinimonas alkaloidigena]